MCGCKANRQASRKQPIKSHHKKDTQFMMDDINNISGKQETLFGKITSKIKNINVLQLQ